MENKEALFRKKAKTYLNCFNEHCPLHSRCLRWEVGRYFDPQTHVANCISPLYAKAADGSCDYFRDNQPVVIPLGMSQRFYNDMPVRYARPIKQALIDHFCRSIYYEYHRGDRPITPRVLAVIQSVCRQAGWTQPLQFDGEVEDYVW